MHREHVSDEALHALIDGEYSPEEAAELMARMQSDPELRERYYAQRMVKDSLHLAYADPPPPRRRGAGAAPARRLWWSTAAGLALLGLGVALGWGLHAGTSTPQRIVLLDPDGRGGAPASAQSEEMRIVFHLTDPDMTAAGELLNEIEALLVEYRAAQAPLRVEVVAHGDGLDVLRTQLSAHRARVQAMADHYQNLTFVACQNTIDRLQVEQGVEVVLLPQARLTESGVDHVVRRQQQGWVYIRV